MKLPIRLQFPFPEPADTGRSLGMKPAEIRKVLALADALAANQKAAANGRVPTAGTQVEPAQPARRRRRSAKTPPLQKAS